MRTMSPLNRGPLLGPRVSWPGIRPPPPPPRFAGRLPPPGMPPRVPPPPMNPVFAPMRQRMPPPPRPGGVVPLRPSGPLPLFGPRARAMPPIAPPVGMRGGGPRGPIMRPWLRRAPPPQILSHMRPRFAAGNGAMKGKAMNNVKRISKLEELELKKPWMTDEIRSEIQKKNKLYAKAKKNKDAKEWEEFKDLRNKVTRMIRDAKNEYLTKHPEQAYLYPNEEEPYDQRDENYMSSEDEASHYCEVCDREFATEDILADHKKDHKVCGIDGCTFSAHPLLIEKHITMQHNSGLYHRMKNLSTPEDIEKWLMERKKRYPTKANIELRKAENLEKMQRGEFIKQQKSLVNQIGNKTIKTRDKKRKTHKSLKPLSSDLPPSKKYRGICVFPGTSILKNESPSKDNVQSKENIEDIEPDQVDHISDEEDIPIRHSEQLSQAIETSAQPIVSSLVANYGSDSEGSDAPEVAPIERLRNKNSDEHKVTDVVAKGSNDIETNNTAHILPNSRAKNVTQKREHVGLNRSSRESKTRGKPIVNRHRPEKLQLLHKLLSRSIQHERNLICQCIKYIIDNNFFD